MKALVADRWLLSRAANLMSGKSIGQGASVKDVSKPTVSPTEILINVRAVALNPIDVKFIDFLAPAGSLLGCDFAGVVVDGGRSAGAGSPWKVGDRVAGFVHGGQTAGHGAFAEYVKAEADLVWRIPEAITDEEACTFGISAVTAMQALHLNLDVPWTDDRAIGGEGDGEEGRKKKIKNASTILIYGASSAVGLVAIQLAKRAGCTVVTTASPHSFELVKGYGADHVYDYKSATAVSDIKTAHPDVSRALDCISDARTTHFCALVLQASGGKVITTLPAKSKIPGVTVQGVMSFQLLGQAFAWLPPIGPSYPASAPDRQALVRFYGSLGTLTPPLRPPPLTVLSNGLDDVQTGLARLRAGKVSGSKLVVKLN